MTHEVVAALIIQSQKLLLGLRAGTREFYPDVWDLFGGHVEAGEKREETLVRELQEELGITPTQWTFVETHTLDIPDPHPSSPKSDKGKPGNDSKLSVVFGGGATRSGRRGSQLIVHLYLVKAWKGTPFNRQPEEHSVIHWFSFEQAIQLPLADPIYLTLFARFLPSE